jgi:hypothetical protein
LQTSAIDWAIFPPTAPIARALSARPGWKKIYGDDYAVVFAREEALPPEIRR